MTKEELKQKAIDYLCKRFELTEDKIKYGDWNFLFQKYIEMYIAGATEATKELEVQIEKIINEIDKTMVLSNMRECEICNIQDIFRKYGFKRNSNDVWEIKENE